MVRSYFTILYQNILFPWSQFKWQYFDVSKLKLIKTNLIKNHRWIYKNVLLESTVFHYTIKFNIMPQMVVEGKQTNCSTSTCDCRAFSHNYREEFDHSYMVISWKFCYSITHFRLYSWTELVTSINIYRTSHVNIEKQWRARVCSFGMAIYFDKDHIKKI